ncbi:30S ribosomal protein S13 [Patescibacteria group bacterium]|nr:30S ribosomal protein S13 [Patescibacteria group bacterium]
MPRLAGIDIPDDKKVRISLRYVYGIGPKLAEEILRTTQVNPDKRAKDLTGEEINKIQRELEKYNVEGNLRRLIRDNVDRLKRIGSYRGLRHKLGLPTRGQRTRSNARTRRNKKRVAVGAISKEMAAKMETAAKK